MSADELRFEIGEVLRSDAFSDAHAMKQADRVVAALRANPVAVLELLGGELLTAGQRGGFDYQGERLPSPVALWAFRGITEEPTP